MLGQYSLALPDPCYYLTTRRVSPEMMHEFEKRVSSVGTHCVPEAKKRGHYE